MSSIDNKVVIITGASSGVGLSAAKLFAEDGAKVVLGARRQPLLEQAVGEIREKGGQAVSLAGDVADESYAKALVELAVGTYSGLDIALNNAGVLGEGKLTTEIDLAIWSRTLAVNLTGAFLGAKHQIPAMLLRGRGSIVFTSSFVGNGVGMPGMADYAVSKAGLSGLTQVLASEFGGQGIRVNSILSGGINTPMGQAAANTPETMSFVEGLHALKRIAEPCEIAQAAIFLASDAASFITGASISVDGGISITRT